MVITGTRPEIVKLSVLLRKLEKDPEVKLIFVHSGQHYDYLMFDIFIKELDLPIPDYNIEIGSNPNSVQTGKMLISLYDIIIKECPHIMVAQGDTNTVFAAALTAFKNNIPFGHLEAGIRSFDFNMPEEVNRRLVAVCTRLNFAPTIKAVQNLLNEGINYENIFLTGNSIVDAVLENLKIASEKSKIVEKLNINPEQKNILLTIHRPSNVDDKENFAQILRTLTEIDNIRIIYPIHPRSKKNLEDFKIIQKYPQISKIDFIDPLGYLDFLKLMANVYLIVTDSGGIQEESIILHKPCVTLRENTERPESVECGGNILVGNNHNLIKNTIISLLNDQEKYKTMSTTSNPFGNGSTCIQIIKIIKKLFKEKKLGLDSKFQMNVISSVKLITIGEIDKGNTVVEFELKNNGKIMEIYNQKGVSILPQHDLKLNIGEIVKIILFTK